jgi:hypothetical protein
VVEHGGVITDAVSTQPWPGEANVDVSIVNWVKQPTSPPERFLLDERNVKAIDTALEESTIPIADVPRLPANRGRAFQGFLPGAQYDLDVESARHLLNRSDADYADVIKPYLDQTPTRYVVDFAQMSLEEAMEYPAALDALRARAQPAREASTSYSRNPQWWQFLWPRPEFRQRAQALKRFIAGSATGKRILFVWCRPGWRPSNSTNVIALDSDYAMGVLTSRVHTDWAAAKSSTLGDTIRYTPSSAFETFPWPQASPKQRDQIEAACRAVLEARASLCREHGIGLTTLYNRVDDGAYVGLRDRHETLDLAVIAAYGWSHALLTDVRGRNQALYELNRAILAGERAYDPF